MPPRRSAIAVALAVLVGCSPAVPSASPSARASTAALTPAPSVTPAASGGSTAAPRLALDAIPRLEIEPDRLTLLCDPEPTQSFAGGPESHLSCADVAPLAIGAFSVLTADTIERIHIRRTVCVEGGPCPAEIVESGTVFGWTATSAFQFEIDVRAESIPLPERTEGADWPSLPVPELEPARPSIDGAPAEVASRVAYPYCGRTRVGDQPRFQMCFLAAVLAGQQAELVMHAFGHDGQEILSVYRFDGRGSVRAYIGVGDAWHTVQGFIHLNPDGQGWSFEPWFGTDRALAR